MASVVDGGASWRADQTFFLKFAVAVTALILIGFLQFALRGMVQVATVPFWVHLHGVLMIAWLGLFITQNWLANTGNLMAHRRLGWIGTYLVVAIAAVGSFTGIMAIKRHAVPPFFTDAFFLALTQVGAVVFGGLVFAAVMRRKQTDYHRRLMMGSLIGLTEPGLGRLLPMPFMNGMGEWAILAIQLVLVGVIARHDRKVLGHIHPATATIGGILAMSHVLVELSGHSPYVQSLAARIAGG